MILTTLDELARYACLGPNKVEQILRVLALESLGVVGDPVLQSLKRLNALPLKSVV